MTPDQAFEVAYAKMRDLTHCPAEELREMSRIKPFKDGDTICFGFDNENPEEIFRRRARVELRRRFLSGLDIIFNPGVIR